MVILDTSIIIDHLRIHARTPSFFETLMHTFPKEYFAISMATVQELYTGKSTLIEKKHQELLATLSPFTMLPYTWEVAVRAGMIMRDQSHMIGFADAMIAATAIMNHAQLATLNTKDFAPIQSLKLFDLS